LLVVVVVVGLVKIVVVKKKAECSQYLSFIFEQGSFFMQAMYGIVAV
jgi:hypothetical protein